MVCDGEHQLVPAMCVTRWPCLTRLPAHRWQHLHALPDSPAPSLSVSPSLPPSIHLCPALALSLALSFWPQEITLTPLGWMLSHIHTYITPLHLWPSIYTDKQHRSSLAASHTQGRISFVWVLSAWGALSPTSIVWSLLYSSAIMGYNSLLSYTGLQSGDGNLCMSWSVVVSECFSKAMVENSF